MKLSVVLSCDDDVADPAAIVEQARLAEELGFAGVWLPDHPLAPEPYGDVYGGTYEPLVLLTHLASVTEHITLGTSVVIAPLREPVLLAKQLATLAQLAPGRVVFGAGVGWERREFDALGVPFAERGARTDAALELIRSVHRGEPHPHGVFAPVPARPVEIMVGGSSAPALRRAARVADRWQGVGLTPAEFRDRRAELNRLAAPRRIEAGLMLPRVDYRRPVDELVTTIDALRDVGCDNVALHFGDSRYARHAMTRLVTALGW